MRKRYTTQNLYKTNLTNPVNGIDNSGNADDVFTITVDETPLSTLSEGFLVIDFNIPDKRDFIKYHDVTGNTFSYYRKDRDLLNNGSKTIRHNAGAYVQINVVKEFTEHLFENVDDFGYIEDFENDDIKVYGGYVDTPAGPTLVADTRLDNLGNGTWYIFFDYADNTFKKLTSTSGYTGVDIATVVVASGDISSITDTRVMVLPTRYDPDIFEFGADGELKLISATTISDATTSNKGRVRLGELQDHEDATVGPVVVATENLVKTSAGASDENKVPILGEDGRLDWSIVPSIILSNATDSGTDEYVTTANPTLLSYETGQIYTITFSETNTTATPTLNIDGLGAVQIRDKNSQDLAIGDLTTNKMILMKVSSSFKVMQELPATTTRQGISEKYNVGGLGGDGDLTISSGTTTITGAGGVAYKEYNNVTISGTATLTSNQRLTHIKVKGNFTMSAGTISVNGLGSNGGSGSNNNGNAMYNQYALTTIGGGISGESTGAGGGATQSTVGKDFIIVHSGGGGGTSQDFNGGASGGGSGGGILILEIGGSINFTGGTISANGSVGGSAGGLAAASGGGGGGGSIVILYRTLTSISGTISAVGGNGGTSAGNSASYNFGGGGGGGYGAGGSYNSSGSNGLALGATATVTGGSAGTGGTQANSRGGGGGGGFVYVTKY